MLKKTETSNKDSITPQDVEAIREALLGLLRLLATAVAQRLREKSQSITPPAKKTEQRGNRKPRRR